VTDDEAWMEFVGQLEASYESNRHDIGCPWFVGPGPDVCTCKDIQAARKIGRSTYDGNAVVLPNDDPLMEEWNRWESLYG
jgi:hypothetical protein